MSDCAYLSEEKCINEDCPICGEFCPLTDYPWLCRYCGEDEREAEQTPPKPYREKDTQCDTCGHLHDCIASGEVLESTIGRDTRKHYIRALMANCVVSGTFFQ